VASGGRCSDRRTPCFHADFVAFPSQGITDGGLEPLKLLGFLRGDLRQAKGRVNRRVSSYVVDIA
jgi:hypothetical protein